MSQADSRAGEFYREVASTGVVWTLRDDRGLRRRSTATGGKRSLSGQRDRELNSVIRQKLR